MSEPQSGAKVQVQWGLDGYVEAEVVEVYGPPTRRHVLVCLTPELSGDIVDDRKTLSVPLAAVKQAEAA